MLTQPAGATIWTSAVGGGCIPACDHPPAREAGRDEAFEFVDSRRPAASPRSFGGTPSGSRLPGSATRFRCPCAIDAYRFAGHEETGVNFAARWVCVEIATDEWQLRHSRLSLNFSRAHSCWASSRRTSRNLRRVLMVPTFFAPDLFRGLHLAGDFVRPVVRNMSVRAGSANAGTVREVMQRTVSGP